MGTAAKELVSLWKAKAGSLTKLGDDDEKSRKKILASGSTSRIFKDATDCYKYPTESLKALVEYRVETQFQDFDTALGNWLQENEGALQAAAIVSTEELVADGTEQPALFATNLDALSAFKAAYDQRMQASDPDHEKWQVDPGYRMLEERGSIDIQT